MGEAFVAIADDATAVFWNPAGLAFQTGQEFIFTHSNWMPQFGGIPYQFASYLQHFKNFGTIAINVTYLGSKTILDISEITLFDFYDDQYSVAFTYGSKITENLGLGTGVRHIRSTLAPFGAGAEKGEVTANAFAADVSLLYKIPWIDGFNVGLNLSNLGPKIVYIDAEQGDPLPTNLKVGFAHKLLCSDFNKLTIAFDANKLLVNRRPDGVTDPWYKALFSSWGNGISDVIYSGGIEYWYNNLIALRAGYYNDNKGDSKYTSLGFGIQQNNWRIDVSRLFAKKESYLNETTRFSFSVSPLNPFSRIPVEKSSAYPAIFKNALRPSFGLSFPRGGQYIGKYSYSPAFGLNLLATNSMQHIWEIGFRYSMLSLTDDYVRGFIPYYVDDITINDSKGGNNMEILAGVKFLLHTIGSNTAYLNLGSSLYIFGDEISVSYSGIRQDWSGSYEVQGNISIEEDQMAAFGVYCGFGSLVQIGTKTALDIQGNLKFMFAKHGIAHWFEPTIGFIYFISV